MIIMHRVDVTCVTPQRAGNMRLSAAGMFTAARKTGGQDHDVNLACTLRYALPKSLASYHLLWGPSGHNEAKPRR